MLPFSTSKDRKQTKPGFGLNSGQMSALHSASVLDDVSATGASLGLDMSLILAPTGGLAKEVRRIQSIAFQLDAEGKPVGPPQDVVIFSDQLKMDITRDPKNPVYQELQYENGPWISTTEARRSQGQFTGFVPISLAFHEMSHREREGSVDVGVDEDDGGPSIIDGSKRFQKIKHKEWNRKSILYESINKIGMVKGDFPFPRRTYLPKNLIPYVVGEDQVPKAIVVERLHRAYRAVDINLVLITSGIFPSDLIPAPRYGETNENFYHEKMFRNRSKIEGLDKITYIYRQGRLDANLRKAQVFQARKNENTATNTGYPTPQAQSKTESMKVSHGNSDDSTSEESIDGSIKPHLKYRPPFDPLFPLHYFDDEEFDIRSGVEWLALGWDSDERKNYAIPGKAYMPFPLPLKKKNLPTLATKTNEILLSKLEKLDKLRKTLMKSRYSRTLFGAGLKSALGISSSSKMESAILEKISHTASTFKTMLQTSVLPSKNSVFTRNLAFAETVIAAMLDKHSSDSDDDFFDDLPKSYAGLQQDIADFKKEFTKPCYTRPSKVYSTNDFEKMESQMYAAGKFDSELELDRSESLLSEVFSQIETLTKPSAEDVVTLKSHDMTEDDLSSSDSDSPVPVQDHVHPHNVKAFPRKSLDTSHLHEAPDSPDEEVYEQENSEKEYIFDYSKMKKPFNYEWKWVDVAVLDYDFVGHQYLVCTIHTKPSRIFAWLGKPYLCFDAEDPYVHTQRIKDAVFRRYEQEHHMRYNLYIDCLPTTDSPTPDDEVVNSIANKINWSPKIKLPEKILGKISQEVEALFQRVHTKLRFDKICERNPNNFKPWVHKPINDFKLDDYNHSHTWESRRNRFNLSKRHFKYRILQLQRKTFLTCKATYTALQAIMGYCEEAKKMSFVVTHLDEYVHLDEYERLQTDHVASVIQYLKNEWYESILSTIRTQLSKVENSWFNLKERDYQAYTLSRLPAFLQLVNSMMEATVRTMLLDSFKAYNNLIQKLTAGCCNKKHLDWGNDLTTSKCPTPKGMKPLYILELTMDSNGPKYTQLLSKYLLTPTRIFNECIKSVQKFPPLLPLLIPHFHGIERSYLHIISEEDTEVHRLRIQSQGFLKIPLQLLDTYAQKFKKYLFMWTMDEHPHPYTQSMDNVHINIADLRRELDRNRADIERVENEIADELTASAFLVNAGIVKQTLIKKKKTACNLMLENLSEKLRNAVLRIMHKYSDCERKLSIRSDDIKEVMDLKQYAENVPGLIADCILQMNRIVKDYEIFDEYHNLLSDEDVENKWVTAAQSHRIMQLVATGLDLLEDDYERLLKVQQQELASISDQIDSASLAIAGLSAHTDLEKAVDAAHDAKKVWLIVKDLEERIQLLNERQVIFKQPVTQENSLHRLFHDIEPYKNLWFTAAECLRVRDSLMKDSLEKIDVSSLTKSVHDGLKVMGHCIQYFKDTPPVQHIALEVKHLIDTYKPILPLVEAFKSPAMRSRHWDEISQICGFPVYAKANEPFKKLLDKDIVKYADAILKIAQTAMKEIEITVAVDKMKSSVEVFSIKVLEEKHTGVQIIMVPDSALETVTHCLVETDKLALSPYKSLSEEKLTSWWKKIHAIKANLEHWFSLQDEWLSLQALVPIIKTQTRTPNVLKIYKRATRVWRRLIRLAKETPMIEEAANNPPVISSLKQFQMLLEKIKEGMDEYANREKSSDSDD